MGASIRTTGGVDAVVDDAAVQHFGASLRGRLLTPSAPGYDEARTIWNAMIDRRPALIARCAGAADVLHAVRFAREHDLLIAVRGGGHNIAGSAVCDGGLMIDLSPMRSVRADPVARRARVGPGATLGDVDHETQAFGLATPLGINSITGVAGLTLGGGFGWLSRHLGLSIDNLVSADVVTADGALVRASDAEHEDLFWGIRGGGGNFGVVTSFEFRLHPVGPQVLAGLIVHPLDAARSVLRFYRDFVESAPDELTTWFLLRKAPPAPFIPPEWHGREILALALCYAGPVEAGERAAKPLRAFGKPLADVVRPQPFTTWQTAFDTNVMPGLRNYWKSHDFLTLSDGLIDVLVEYARALPAPQSQLAFAHLGGAVSRVPRDATAYPHRDTPYILNVHGRWAEPARDAECIAWARALHEAATPFATGGVYVNFLTQEEGERVRAAYGASYDRIAALKHRYDPSNFFRMNQNVRPAGRPVPFAMPEERARDAELRA